MIGAHFDSTKPPLQELLARAGKGAPQLPDFQRGWFWPRPLACAHARLREISREILIVDGQKRLIREEPLEEMAL